MIIWQVVQIGRNLPPPALSERDGIPNLEYLQSPHEMGRVVLSKSTYRC